MSFILDALRKSESERQQDARPSITRIPSAVPQRGLPAWAVATIAALGLGVVVLAGAWLKTLAGPDARSSTVTTADERPPDEADAAARGNDNSNSAVATASFESGSRAAGLPPDDGSGRVVEPLRLPPQRTTSFSGSIASESRPTPRLGDRAGRSPLAAAVQSSSLERTARAEADGTGQAAPAVSGGTRPGSIGGEALPQVESVPPVYHSMAQTLGLPDLTLELLAYSEDPAERWVFINGSRYAIGDTLPDGARVIAINARGAVLLVQGRQLQLEQR